MWAGCREIACLFFIGLPLISLNGGKGVMRMKKIFLFAQ